MIPILLKLGPITIYSYGMMMALGFLAADFVISSRVPATGAQTRFASRWSCGPRSEPSRARVSMR
jgi:prolipoprotein diacylglyceryltransferase